MSFFHHVKVFFCLFLEECMVIIDCIDSQWRNDIKDGMGLDCHMQGIWVLCNSLNEYAININA